MLHALRRWTSRVKRRLSAGLYRLGEMLGKPWIFTMGFIALIVVLFHIAYLYTAITLILFFVSLRIYLRRAKRKVMAKRRLIK